ncbi:GTP cyclohydrolase FolE2 [Cupriavidus metallidurans]|jgi:GTP cyclohydrolase IB|nr:GTP cyclohydrolase FolE2 [Cupriavidus metallidurans]
MRLGHWGCLPNPNESMSAALPDVSLTDVSPTFTPLEWVGMQGIDLPIRLVEPGYRRQLHARADLHVDLPAPRVKGIHMSRLYALLDALDDGEGLSPIRIRQLLEAMVDSHRDCETGSARLRLRFDLLVRRSALVTEGIAGWKSYPVRLDASLVGNVFALTGRITAGYSSTCPCSAALARQLVEQGFEKAFAHERRVDVARVLAWLRQHGTLATPHSQRSEAAITVDVAVDLPNLGLLDLVDHIERALGTPVQTAVKRADEQAFAALNGQNLMFVEDAARRIQVALDGRFANPRVHVRHLESLHPHDAVAWAAPLQTKHAREVAA